MAITNGYATLAELKERLEIDSAITTYDGVLEQSIEAASRLIDTSTNRVFYSTAAVRYYTAQDWHTLFCDDDILSLTEVATVLSSAAGLRVYSSIWNVNDYDLEPYNQPPYTRVVCNTTGLNTFPIGRRTVKLTGTFGYCTTGAYPKPINEACLRQAARLYEVNKTPLAATIGYDAITQQLRVRDYDGIVNGLLQPYVKMFIMLPAPVW